MTPLDDFVSDPNLTPADWDAADFVGGAQKALQDAEARPTASPRKPAP